MKVQDLVEHISRCVRNQEMIPEVLKNRLLLQVKSKEESGKLDEVIGLPAGTVWSWGGMGKDVVENPFSRRRDRYPLYSLFVSIILCEIFLCLSSLRLYQNVLHLTLSESLLRVMLTELIPINSIVVVRLLNPPLVQKTMAKGLLIFFFFWGSYSSWGERFDDFYRGLKKEEAVEDQKKHWDGELERIERDLELYQKKQEKSFSKVREESVKLLLESRRDLLERRDDAVKERKKEGGEVHQGHVVMDLLLKLVIQVGLYLFLEVLFYRLF